MYDMFDKIKVRAHEVLFNDSGIHKLHGAGDFPCLHIREFEGGTYLYVETDGYRGLEGYAINLSDLMKFMGFDIPIEWWNQPISPSVGDTVVKELLGEDHV